MRGTRIIHLHHQLFSMWMWLCSTKQEGRALYRSIQLAQLKRQASAQLYHITKMPTEKCRPQTD
nr:MAG TPA: hypothetical protein [Caudoviricetes sp.]